MATEKEIEAAAVALFQVEWAPAMAKGYIPTDLEGTKQYWKASAKAALEAAERVRNDT